MFVLHFQVQPSDMADVQQQVTAAKRPNVQKGEVYFLDLILILLIIHYPHLIK